MGIGKTISTINKEDFERESTYNSVMTVIGGASAESRLRELKGLHSSAILEKIIDAIGEKGALSDADKMVIEAAEQKLNRG